MKSKLQKLTILALTICMILGLIFTPVTTVVTQAASSKTVAAMKAYSAMLSKSTIKWYDSTFKTSALDFGCVDINKDGYPELIVYNNDACEAECPLRVYTYYNKKVKLIAESSYEDDITIYPSGKIFISTTGHSDYEIIKYYGISKGKSVLKASCEKNIRTGSATYKIGKTKVSKSKYTAYIKKLKKGSKKSYKLVKNTRTNRNSVIGKYLPISISKTSVSVTQGSSVSLYLNNTNKKAKWKTNNSSVATVSSTGKVKAKKKGTATITATLSGKKYTCKIKVKGSYSAKVTNLKLTNAPTSYYNQLEGDGAIAMLTFSKPSQATGYKIVCYYKTAKDSPWYEDSKWHYSETITGTKTKYYLECGSAFWDNDEIKLVVTPYLTVKGVKQYGTSVSIAKKLGKIFV